MKQVIKKFGLLKAITMGELDAAEFDNTLEVIERSVVIERLREQMDLLNEIEAAVKAEVDYQAKYEKCIATIRKFDAGLIPPKGESPWISVGDDRPPHLKTVWLCNREKGWVWLGCRVVGDEGYHWAASNGIIYSGKGEIVAECESDDLDVTHFCYLPMLPAPRATTIKR